MTAVVVKTHAAGPPAKPTDAMGPSIITAFREQLKLKPESQKGPFEIFESNALRTQQLA